MAKTKSKNEPSEKEVLELAAKAQVDPRTARKALTKGVEALRNRFLKERVREAMKVRLSEDGRGVQ